MVLTLTAVPEVGDVGAASEFRRRPPVVVDAEVRAPIDRRLFEVVGLLRPTPSRTCSPTARSSRTRSASTLDRQLMHREETDPGEVVFARPFASTDCPVVGPAHFDEAPDECPSHPKFRRSRPTRRRRRLRVAASRRTRRCSARAAAKMLLVLARRRLAKPCPRRGHLLRPPSRRTQRTSASGRRCRPRRPNDRFHRGPVDGASGFAGCGSGSTGGWTGSGSGAFTGGFGLGKAATRSRAYSPSAGTLLELPALVVFGLDGRCVFCIRLSGGPHDEVLLVGVRSPPAFQ